MSTEAYAALMKPPQDWWNQREQGLGGGQIPGEGWPQVETIEYISKFLILIVLLLALPWLLSKLLTAPHEVSGHAAGLSMGAASMGA